MHAIVSVLLLPEHRCSKLACSMTVWQTDGAKKTGNAWLALKKESTAVGSCTGTTDLCRCELRGARMRWGYRVLVPYRALV